MSAAPDVLLCQGLTLGQGRRALLQDTSFRLPPGSVTLLRGCNGAGKTTLLQAMLGLVRPQAGEIRVMGARAGVRRRAVGYLPQVRPLPAERFKGRVLVEAAWHGTRLGVPGFGARMGRAVSEALTLVDAAHIAERPLGDLSGGERQRIGLAAALVDSPSLLLLDEPLAGLDVVRQDGLARLLARLHAEHALPMVISAHGPTPLDQLATHTLTIEGGRALLVEGQGN